MFYELNNYLYLIVIPIILGIMFFWWWKKDQEDRQKILFQRNWNQKRVENILAVKIILLFSSIILLLGAVWRPQWGAEEQDISRRGLDLVFTVDVSKSMQALDFSQGRNLISRLEAVKFLIDDFVKKRKSDRVALVEFAGESFVASPLTLDHNVFTNFLKNISSNDIVKQGTNLAEALEISISRLEIKNDRERSKVILLFSDGDETINSAVEKIAQRAKNKNIIIYTIGIGSETGSRIPEGQDAWGQIIYKKYHGKEVITKLNPEPLKKIAAITGGEYYHAENIADLKSLQKKLETIPKKVLHDTTLIPQAERYWYFAFLGLLFFLGGFLLPQNISGKFKTKFKKKNYENK